MLDWVCSSHRDATDGSEIFGALKASENASECLVDLKLSGWVGPGMMASLAAFLDLQRRLARPVDFRSPENSDVANYLSRMGMGRVLDDAGILHDLPPVRANLLLNERALVEVQPFTCEEDVEGLIEILNYQDIASELQRTVSRAILEAGCNVPEHARVEHGFIAAQVMDRGRFLRFAVADCGIGVRATLAAVGAETERQALVMALSGNSETGDPGRGKGLPSIRDGIALHGGHGSLISGGAIATMRATKIFPWVGNASGYPGTLLDVCLPIG